MQFHLDRTGRSAASDLPSRQLPCWRGIEQEDLDHALKSAEHIWHCSVVPWEEKLPCLSNTCQTCSTYQSTC